MGGFYLSALLEITIIGHGAIGTSVLFKNFDGDKTGRTFYRKTELYHCKSLTGEPSTISQSASTAHLISSLS